MTSEQINTNMNIKSNILKSLTIMITKYQLWHFKVCSKIIDKLMWEKSKIKYNIK